jgi:hypothetical protein
MQHFYRTQLTPAATIEFADEFFTKLGLRVSASSTRTRTYEGIVGTPEVVSTIRLQVKSEGGHYTFVEVDTDQMGESRVDRNVKRLFVELHRLEEPAHRLEAAY